MAAKPIRGDPRAIIMKEWRACGTDRGGRCGVLCAKCDQQAIGVGYAGRRAVIFSAAINSS